MRLFLFSGRSNPGLARAVCLVLGIQPGECILEPFPDQELHVEIQEDVVGADVYLLQSTNPPVADHLLELMLLADACRRAGASRLTAVVPYFGYARQERRVRKGEPVAARLVADILSARMDRMILVDLHNAAVEGFFGIPVEHLTAVPILAEALRPALSERHTVVAPDLGAVKLAQRFADILGLPAAYIHKERKGDRQVAVRRIIGEVRGRSPVIVDDMISTGGTIMSAVEALLAEGCTPEVGVAAVHGVMADASRERFAEAPLETILLTDSISQSEEGPLPLQVCSLQDLVAEKIKGLHAGGS